MCVLRVSTSVPFIFTSATHTQSRGYVIGSVVRLLSIPTQNCESLFMATEKLQYHPSSKFIAATAAENSQKLLFSPQKLYCLFFARFKGHALIIGK